MAHESDRFKAMQEYGSGARYEGRTDLGNTKSGDGRRYKGRGYIQLTGRANYRKYGKMIGVDLENNPTKAEEPEIAAKIAIAYWNDRIKRNVGGNFGNTQRVTKLINGGYNGYKDRQNLYQKYKSTVKFDESLDHVFDVNNVESSQEEGKFEDNIYTSSVGAATNTKSTEAKDVINGLKNSDPYHIAIIVFCVAVLANFVVLFAIVTRNKTPPDDKTEALLSQADVYIAQGKKRACMCNSQELNVVC